MDICGNCGAPLDLNEDGECRWCRARVRARRTRSFASGNRPALSWKWNRRIAAITAIAIGLAVGLGVGIASYAGGHQSGPPAATASGQSPGVPVVAPGSTDLQALRQDFGPWRQLTGQPPAGSPALLLLQDGAAAASARWTVPPTATWWAQDLGGNVTSVAASGYYAVIADADGISYTVGINQAFVLASNPGTVLLISPSSTVMSMSLAQATAVRQPLAR